MRHLASPENKAHPAPNAKRAPGGGQSEPRTWAEALQHHRHKASEANLMEVAISCGASAVRPSGSVAPDNQAAKLPCGPDPRSRIRRRLKLVVWPRELGAAYTMGLRSACWKALRDFKAAVGANRRTVSGGAISAFRPNGAGSRLALCSGASPRGTAGVGALRGGGRPQRRAVFVVPAGARNRALLLGNMRARAGTIR